jgi:hypothetical protein
MTIDEARAKAHQQYDDCMFCPGCSKLLTGLHMGESVLHQLDRKKGTTDPRKFEGNEEPIIIGLAIAVIIGTGIVCLMDALKNKLK